MVTTPAAAPPAAAGGGGGIDPGEPPQGAVVGETLKDFQVTDSLVFPRGAANEIPNITQIAPRVFNFLLRHRGNPHAGQKGAWYDGDRDLQWNEGRHKSLKGKPGAYKDKSRAEMCCLKGIGTRAGPKLGVGDTWLIGTTVRLDPDFVPSKGYCNVMQPVFDQSFVTLFRLTGNVVRAKLVVFSNGIGSAQLIAREFDIPRGEWVSLAVRVHFAKKGKYELSVNGDPFRGIAADTTKGRQPFGSQWGLYGSGTKDVNNKPLGDSQLQHRNIYLKKLS